MHLPSLETKDLLLIRAVSEAGGITKAGKQLGLTQSAVSHHLSRLEERLGVTLFRRVGRGVQITGAGTRLLLAANDVLKRLSEIEREVVRPRRTRIRLSTQCHTAYDWLPAVLTRFGEHHPEVDVEIRVEATAAPLAALARDEIDVAICHAKPPFIVDGRPQSPTRFHSTSLFVDHFVAVVPVDHALAKSKSIAPKELAGVPLYIHDIAPEDFKRWGVELFGRGPTPSRVHRLPLTEAIISMVKAGFGLSIMPNWATRGAVERRDVVALTLTSKFAKRRWRAVRQADASSAAVIDALSGVLKTAAPIS